MLRYERNVYSFLVPEHLFRPSYSGGVAIYIGRVKGD